MDWKKRPIHLVSMFTRGLKFLLGLVYHLADLFVAIDQSIVDINTRISSHPAGMNGIQLMMRGSRFTEPIIGWVNLSCDRGRQ
jgi:hypothetical protein